MPFFVPSQFLLIRMEMCCVELESPAQIVRPQAAHNGRGIARLGLNLPPGLTTRPVLLLEGETQLLSH